LSVRYISADSSRDPSRCSGLADEKRHRQ
jgi:hypothetical protein